MAANVSEGSWLASVAGGGAGLAGARRGGGRSAAPALVAVGFAARGVGLAGWLGATAPASVRRGIGKEAEAVIVPPRAPSASHPPRRVGPETSVRWLARWWRPRSRPQHYLLQTGAFVAEAGRKRRSGRRRAEAAC